MLLSSSIPHSEVEVLPESSVRHRNWRVMIIGAVRAAGRRAACGIARPCQGKRGPFHVDGSFIPVPSVGVLSAMSLYWKLVYDNP